MSPDLGFKSPVMSPKIVLLPAPFWPMRVIFAPSRTEKLTSSRMGFVWPYSNDAFSNRTTVLFPDIRRTYSIFAETQSDFGEKSLTAPMACYWNPSDFHFRQRFR